MKINNNPRTRITLAIIIVVIVLLIAFSQVLQSSNSFSNNNPSQEEFSTTRNKNASSETKMLSNEEKWQQLIKSRKQQDESLSCQHAPWTGAFSGASALKNLLLMFSSSNNSNVSTTSTEEVAAATSSSAYSFISSSFCDDKKNEKIPTTKTKNSEEQQQEGSFCESLHLLVNSKKEVKTFLSLSAKNMKMKKKQLQQQQQEEEEDSSRNENNIPFLKLLQSQQNQHSKFLTFLQKDDRRKECIRNSNSIVQEVADAVTVKSPSFLCSNPSSSSSSSTTNNENENDERAGKLTLEEKRWNMIPKNVQQKLLTPSPFISKKVKKNFPNSNEASAFFVEKKKVSTSSSEKQFLFCPKEFYDIGGATVLECSMFYQQQQKYFDTENETSSSTTNKKKIMKQKFLHQIYKLDQEEMESAAKSSKVLLDVVQQGFLHLLSSSNNNNKNNNENQQQKSSSSSFSFLKSWAATTSSSSPNNININVEEQQQQEEDSTATDFCPLEEISGPILAQIRANILKDRTDHELFLFSDSSFVVSFSPSVVPMKNLPFFSNAHAHSAAASQQQQQQNPESSSTATETSSSSIINNINNEPIKYSQKDFDTTTNTGGFPTFEILGAQPGLFVSIFTHVVVGNSYVFTCSGRMYGNGGSKEHRFEFVGSENLKKGGSSKVAAKLPCRPLAAAFSSHGNRNSVVPVAIPLCTSRYCRWYGIYHFMLEHLPQLILVVDVLQKVPGSFLVVTETPTATTRSLLVDAMGIPSHKIIVGPVKADVALLPTPGLVYRPLSYALKHFRRVILSRMGLEWRSVVDSTATYFDNNNNVNNKSNNNNFESVLNPNSKTLKNNMKTFPRRFCQLESNNNKKIAVEPEIRLLFSERTQSKTSVEQKQVRLPKNWQEIKNYLRNQFPCVRFQTEKEIREDVRDTIFSFYEADIVLGVHGANLLFTTFMRRGTHVIEMISSEPSLNPRCFYNVAAEVGVKYSAVLHDGGFKLQEYNYRLDPVAVARRVNASIQDIVENL